MRNGGKEVLTFNLALATASLALAFCFPAYADFTGNVVAVADGDTITVLRDREQVKIRLLEIGAPEKRQAFGNRSKQSLSDLCFNKTATLADKGKDRYGRTLAQIASYLGMHYSMVSKVIKAEMGDSRFKT
ncbi:MAG TPA: thermonuclease family protein [Burkholderiales bacterium]|nr:thermonuclease family protein [Burkholderiales bacterium]